MSFFSSRQFQLVCLVILCVVLLSAGTTMPITAFEQLLHLTNAHPSGLPCLLWVWGWLHLLTLPVLWQLSMITLRMDADLPLTSSGLETRR